MPVRKLDLYGVLLLVVTLLNEMTVIRDELCSRNFYLIYYDIVNHASSSIYLHACVSNEQFSGLDRRSW